LHGFTTRGLGLAESTRVRVAMEARTQGAPHADRCRRRERRAATLKQEKLVMRMLCSLSATLLALIPLVTLGGCGPDSGEPPDALGGQERVGTAKSAFMDPGTYVPLPAGYGHYCSVLLPNDTYEFVHGDGNSDPCGYLLAVEPAGTVVTRAGIYDMN